MGVEEWNSAYRKENAQSCHYALNFDRKSEGGQRLLDCEGNMKEHKSSTD